MLLLPKRETKSVHFVSEMKNYQRDFIEFAIDYDVLRFGEFTLKSGRKSPFFFNAGLFNDGRALAQLGHFYAAALHDHGHSFDLLFGPAYKGIPLVSTTAVALYQDHQWNTPYAFNRKEAKDHGEGGNLVGTPLDGRRVMIVDDVITAGTAIRESIQLIQQAKGASLVGVIVALDRQERGRESSLSAIQELVQQYGVPVISIITLTDILTYLESRSDEYAVHLENLRAYRAEFGAPDLVK